MVGKLYSRENSLHAASRSISGHNHLENNLALYHKIEDVISPHLTTQHFHPLGIYFGKALVHMHGK